VQIVSQRLSVGGSCAYAGERFAGVSRRRVIVRDGGIDWDRKHLTYRAARE